MKGLLSRTGLAALVLVTAASLLACNSPSTEPTTTAEAAEGGARRSETPAIESLQQTGADLELAADPSPAAMPVAEPTRVKGEGASREAPRVLSTRPLPTAELEPTRIPTSTPTHQPAPTELPVPTPTLTPTPTALVQAVEPAPVATPEPAQTPTPKPDISRDLETAILALDWVEDGLVSVEQGLVDYLYELREVSPRILEAALFKEWISNSKDGPH